MATTNVKADRTQSGRTGCRGGVLTAAPYYQDPFYFGRPRELLFDPSTISTDKIVAFEYFANRMQVPSRYVTSRDCGTLVIFTRR